MKNVNKRPASQERKEELLKYLAWRIFPITFYQARSILYRLGYLSAVSSKVLDEMVKEGILIQTHTSASSFYDPTYHLTPACHLQQYELLKNESDAQYTLLPNELNYEQTKVWPVIGEWRRVLLNYVRGYKITEVPDMVDREGVLIPLFEAMSRRAYWKDFLQYLSADMLFEVLNYKLYLWTLSLEEPDIPSVYELFVNHPLIDIPTRQLFKETLAFHEYILPGHFDEFPSSLSLQSLTPPGKCAYAFYLTYKGRYKDAVKLFQEVLKIKVATFFPNPFYNLAYIRALICENTAITRKKLVSLNKKQEWLGSWETQAALILIKLYLNEKPDAVLENIAPKYLFLPPGIQASLSLVIRHYLLSNVVESLPPDTGIQQIIDHDWLKLLQLEYSQDFPLFKLRHDSLMNEIGASPLLPPYVLVPEWQRTLNVLEDITSKDGRTPSNRTLQASQSRIIYCIGHGNSIIPRLQKSKDGVNWSNGRNIALSTFMQKDTPGMNEIDMQLARCVKRYTTDWYGKEYYELNSPEAFAALAGYPLVFLENNQDTPVVIARDEPQIIVTKTKRGGYSIQSNITKDELKKISIKEESNVLYKVITLTTMQIQILENLLDFPLFPPEAQGPLSDMLGKLCKYITIHSDLLPSGETLATVKADSLIIMQLQPMGDGMKAELFVKPFTDQPPYCKAGEGAHSIIGTKKGKRVQARRNLKKETEHFEVISSILQQISGNKDVADVCYLDNYYSCLQLLETLQEHKDICRVEWPEGVKLSLKRSVDFPDLSLSVRGVSHWFEVDGEIKIDSTTRLKINDLLKKVRESKGRFIALNDTEFLALSKKLRRQLEELDAMSLQKEKGKIQMSQLHATMLSGLEHQGVCLKKDNIFTTLQARIEAANQEKFPLPKTLQTELRNYQEEGFRWMSRLAEWGAGACLADDMGLGKTIQAITVMLNRGKKGASLVVAPASVLHNWKNEIQRFAPSLTPQVMYVLEDKRKKMVLEADNFDVIITTYGLLVNEVELLASKEWNMIVLDEAHNIKNRETRASKAAMQLQGDFRLMLTGTPLQNHLGEIWNLFEFANPGLLGSFQHFTEKFIIPIEKEENKQRQMQLKKILLPFLLRRTKAEVLDELPEKTEITIQVELSANERALYEMLRQQALLNLQEQGVTGVQTLAEIMRLRKAACHPALINPTLNLESSKTQTFLKLVEELISNNHRALVFSQFTSHLTLISKELDERGIGYLYLDGTLSAAKRTAMVKSFQTGEQPLFLISLKAGGQGLNLTAADYVIHLDPWWNPAIEDQASDRAHRIGQLRPVTIYRLITTQTIEEKIIQLHQTKKSLADSLLEGSGIAHKLTKEELLSLLQESCI